jgi:hypothetical protein
MEPSCATCSQMRTASLYDVGAFRYLRLLSKNRSVRIRGSRGLPCERGRVSVARKRTIARLDFVTRYFLRRLAQAQREGARSHSSRPYTRALAEVIALFVLMPGIAVFCVAAWACVRAPVALVYPAYGQFPLAAVMIFTFALVLTGHIWFTRRLRGFRQDLSAAHHFDTEEDREIAFWQKFCVIALCGVAAPLGTLMLVMNP